MKMVRNLLAAACLVVMSSGASAISVSTPDGTITWDPNVTGPDQDFTGRFSFNQWFDGFVDPASISSSGVELMGTGEFTSFNGTPQSEFAPGGHELTLDFGGFTTDGAGSFNFDNAFVNFWVSPDDYDNSADPLTEMGMARNGSLFLAFDVVGLDFTTLPGSTGPYSNGFLSLALSVVGGAAQSYFDTDTIPLGLGLDPADAQSAASALFREIAPGRFVGTSTGEIFGDSNPIPEPMTVALLGIGLLGIAGVRREV